MKLEKNNKYFTIAVYAVLTSITILIAALAIFHFKEVLAFFINILRTIYRLLKPLIIGGIIAYLLDPIVEFYEKRCQNKKIFNFKTNWFHLGKNSSPIQAKSTKKHLRTMPTVLTTLTLIALIGLFILIVTMNVKNVLGTASIHNISSSMDKYIAYFENMLGQVTSFADRMPFLSDTNDVVQDVYNYINGFVAILSNKVIHFFAVLGANTMNILLAFVIAFYLLQDKKRMLLLINKIYKSVLPEKVYRVVKVLGSDIDYIFSNYIRGQMIDAVIIAILTSLALTLIKMDFAIIIGIIAGLFNLIPYFGPVVGFVLAGLIGLIDGNPMKAVYGVAALVIIQQIDGWVIVPKVVGGSVKLHPVVVLLSILIGGSLFGLGGMLLGVPVAAFIRLVILRYMKDTLDVEEH
jgi:predicted PurR-regulated permease PerM